MFTAAASLTFTLQTSIKKLTFASAAQILRNVDPSHTTQLSSGALGPPAKGQKWRKHVCESRPEEEEELLQVKIHSTDLLLSLKTSEPEKCHNSRSSSV